MAKRRTALAAAIAMLACGSVIWSVMAQDGDNLVQNFDFEDGDAPWSVWVEDGGAGVDRGSDNGEAFSGKNSYMIDIFNAGGGQRVELHQNPFLLEAGQQMTFALWLKSDKVRPARMIVNHRAAPWTSYGAGDIMIMDGDWEEHWIPVDVTANDDIVGIYLELRDTKGVVWVDRVRFYEGEYVPEEGFGEPQAVDAHAKLAVSWASLRAAR
ncbi:hypothetical protein CMK11_09995 [Candidatus Poribacteria bacterium]|nr:hypothetical protein [Candidatus Poribacteria bacterium]